MPVDEVRVISNKASGETGRLLQKALSGLKANVTLLSGPFSFDILRKSLVSELKTKKYDAVVHSAAVSDFQPTRAFKGKISSAKGSLMLKLERTPKIIDLIKRISPDSLLIGFKFEPRASKEKLVKEARQLLKKSGAEFTVANTDNKGYRAFIVSKATAIGPFLSKKSLANALARVLSREI